MSRVVVDTNTIVSAFLWGGTPRQLFNLAIAGGITLLSSDAMVQELENTLNKPKLEKYVNLSSKTPAELVSDFVKLVTPVEPAEIPADAVRDPMTRKCSRQPSAAERPISFPVMMICYP